MGVLAIIKLLWVQIPYFILTPFLKGIKNESFSCACFYVFYNKYLVGNVFFFYKYQRNEIIDVASK